MSQLLTPMLLLLALTTASAPTLGDMRDTKHNLSKTSPTTTEEDSRSRRERETREICVFCHTPNADEIPEDRAEISLPKWQQGVGVAETFELFDDIGRMGVDQEGGGQKVGSVSVACLSCHDGTQAFNVTTGMIGKGQDHPYGVPYRGYIRGDTSARAFRDRIMAAQDSPVSAGVHIGDDSQFRPARSGMINKRQIWWASNTESQQRTKNDLPLYPRTVSVSRGNYETIPFVECTSCHDPHSTREVFLRKSNEGSALCATCHVK